MPTDVLGIRPAASREPKMAPTICKVFNQHTAGAQGTAWTVVLPASRLHSRELAALNRVQAAACRTKHPPAGRRTALSAARGRSRREGWRWSPQGSSGLRKCWQQRRSKWPAPVRSPTVREPCRTLSSPRRKTSSRLCNEGIGVSEPHTASKDQWLSGGANTTSLLINPNTSTYSHCALTAQGGQRVQHRQQAGPSIPPTPKAGPHKPSANSPMSSTSSDTTKVLLVTDA